MLHLKMKYLQLRRRGGMPIKIVTFPRFRQKTGFGREPRKYEKHREIVVKDR